MISMFLRFVVFLLFKIF